MAESDTDQLDINESKLTEQEKIVAEQYDLLDRLRKERPNFDKYGPNRRSTLHFTNRLNRISQCIQTFNSNHRALVRLKLSRDHEYFINEIFDRYQSEHADAIDYIETKFDQIHPNRNESASSSITSSANTSERTTTLIREVQIESSFKPPEFKIDPFNGEPTEWPTFHASFQTIHQNSRLSKQQKFVYLKTFLTANVTSTIAHLEITGDNYDEAWEDLKERYSNEQILFTACMRKFMNLPSFTNRESSAELKLLHDVARACIVQLKNLNFNTEENSKFFAFHLLEKLSPSTRLEFEQYRKEPKTVATFQQLLDFLKSTFLIADAASYTTTNAESNRFSHPRSSNSLKKTNSRQETKNFHVSSKSIVCPIEKCKGQHVLRKCQQFLQWSPAERKNFINQQKLCFNCLGHSISTQCTSKHTCYTCGRRHHSLLHLNQPSLSSNAIPFINSNNASTSTTVNHAPTTNPQVISNNLVHAKSTVLLATAIVNVLDVHGQFIRLRALVDNGSQQSIITERAAQRLKLPFIPFCVGYRSMGNDQYKIADNGLNLNIHSVVTSDFNFTSAFAVLPTITSELPFHSVHVNSWSHLENFTLADPHYNTPGQIDLLLASDVYRRIIEDDIR